MSLIPVPWSRRGSHLCAHGHLHVIESMCGRGTAAGRSGLRLLAQPARRPLDEKEAHLAARVEELAHATTGLDAVALTRTIHAILNLTLDLAHRVLDHLAAHDVGLPGATNRRP